MQLRISRISFAVVALLGFSCDPPDELPADAGRSFFPLKVGAWALYEVDSTRIIQNVSTAFSYQLRTTVVDSFSNTAGGYTYVVRREKRSDASSDWVAAGTWTSWTDERQALVAEGNTRYLKLQFPVEVGLKWDGNEFNTEGGDEQCNGKQCDRYEVVSVNDSFANAYLTAGQWVRIQQHDDPDVLVKKDIRTEVYVRDIGLAQKDVTVLDYCTEQACYGKQFVTSGLVYRMELMDFGNNDL